MARILLVDDEPDILKFLREFLSRHLPDSTIETAHASDAALERIAMIDFDVVLSDIKMPDMDGLALLEKVRAIRPQTQILLMTGVDQRDVVLQALRGGAYDFISKPIDLDYLLAAVKRAIELRHLKAQVRQREKDHEIILNSVSAMIWYKDRNNKILRVNKAAADSIGLEPQAIEGRQTEEFYPIDAAKYHADDLEVI